MTDMITQQKLFNPGDRLPSEFELCRMLNVSRTTLREALRTLSAQGILDIKRGKGTFVANSKKLESDISALRLDSIRVNIKDLYEMRLIFEPQAAYYAAKRATDAEIAKILEYGNQIEQFILAGDNRWNEYEQRFHNSIASATHNPFIKTLLPTFGKAIHKGVALVEQSPSLANDTLSDHRNIMNYLSKRSCEGAYTAMRLHIINTMRNFDVPVD